MLSSGAFSILGTEPVTLLILDPQNDFHTGTLGNSNASKDARRITELIRRNLDCIDNIVISMDSHQRNHIAHAVFWKSGEGFTDEHKETHIKKKLNPHLFQPKVFTSISTQDILDRIWVPVDQSLLVMLVRQYFISLSKVSEFRRIIVSSILDNSLNTQMRPDILH